MSAFNRLLEEALQINKIALQDEAKQRLVHYLEMMQKWNRVFNLTAITDPHEMVYLHLIDSLSVQPYLHGTRLLDVGTGAGLPGIPLAITNANQSWVLLDKNNKKTKFLTQAVAELGLTNVEVVHSRTEDFHPSAGFDSILSRAFSTLLTFTESTAHLLDADGYWIAMKGKYPDEEIAALPATIALDKAERIAINGVTIDRHIVCLSNKIA